MSVFSHWDFLPLVLRVQIGCMQSSSLCMDFTSKFNVALHANYLAYFTLELCFDFCTMELHRFVLFWVSLDIKT